MKTTQNAIVKNLTGYGINQYINIAVLLAFLRLISGSHALIEDLT